MGAHLLVLGSGTAVRHALERDELSGIAEILVHEVFQREGLKRRKCILHVDDLALQAIVDTGYHPQLGARALRRSIRKTDGLKL